MKKLLFPSLLLFVLACSDSDEPQPAACQPTEIEDYDGFASSFYYFEESFNGRNLLSEVSVYPGTDFALGFTYDYLQGKLNKIASSRDGFTINYTPTFEGDRLTKLSGTPFGFGIVLYEVEISYTGDEITRWDQYIGDPTTGTLYQFQHYEFTYDNGNLSTSKFYYDPAVFAALNQEQVPSAYNPELLINMEYGYGTVDAPNPLYGLFILEDPVMSLMANVPTTKVQRNVDGSLVGSLGYEITFNEQGFPILAQSTSPFINFTYDCN